jgi:hypothetical protein
MARYQSEMNEFSYCATLHISHPSMPPEEITAVLGIIPQRQTGAGSPRRTPNGAKLGGSYSSNHWSCELPTTDGERLAEFLWRIVEMLSSRREFLTTLSSSGGEIECFVGLFTERNCDELFPCDLLSAMGSLSIGLRLDIYGKELPQKSIS